MVMMHYRIEKGEYRGRTKGWWITHNDVPVKFCTTRKKARAWINRSCLNATWMQHARNRLLITMSYR